MGTASHKVNRQQGMTLVELLVALVLGVIIMLAATQLFAYTKQSTRAQEAAARLMENGRAATEILNRHIRMARYFGCAGVEAASVSNHYDSTRSGPENPTSLNGYDQQGIFGVDGASGAPDTITVFQGVDDRTELLGEALDTTAGSNPMKLPVGHPFGIDDTVAITDCTQADVFNISALDNSGDPEELSFANCASCTRSYNVNAVIIGVDRSRFYIANGSSGEPSLFVDDPWVNNTALELIEGVEDMQITYGRDTDADGITDQYVTPSVIRAECVSEGTFSCWRQVTSVRISLLLRSIEDNVAIAAQTYSYNGTTTTATDRRFRREFFTVVALRNYRP